MLTTENYPDVSYGPTKIAEWVIIFYIFYIFFVLFVIMSIILAVNYEAFKDLKITNRNKKKQQDYDSLMKEREALLQCFTQLWPYIVMTNIVMAYAVMAAACSDAMFYQPVSDRCFVPDALQNVASQNVTCNVNDLRSPCISHADK